MEEKIYQMLIEKLGKTSLSERTIRAKAVRLAKKYTKEEDLTDEVVSDAIDDLKDIEGQYNHEVSEYIKAHPAPKVDPKPAPKPNPETKTEDQSELEKRVTDMEKQLAAAKKEREDEIKRMQLETLTSSVKATLSNSGCSDADILELAMAKNAIDPEKTVEENTSNVRKWYDEKISSRVKSGMMPQGAVVVPVSQLTDEERAAAAKARSARADKMQNKLN